MTRAIRDPWAERPPTPLVLFVVGCIVVGMTADLPTGTRRDDEMSQDFTRRLSERAMDSHPILDLLMRKADFKK